MQMPELDDYDLDILSLLKDHARMSYSEIGKKVGLSRVAVKNRIKNMESRGVIVAYKTHTARPEKAEEIMFFMDITTTAESFERVIEKLKSYVILRQVYTTTGECRIHCVGFSPNPKKMQDFVNGVYRDTEGIKRLECHAVLSKEKDMDEMEQIL